MQRVNSVSWPISLFSAKITVVLNEVMNCLNADYDILKLNSDIYNSFIKFKILTVTSGFLTTVPVIRRRRLKV